MKYKVVIPETIITLETKGNEKLPLGTLVTLSLPVNEQNTIPVFETPPVVIPDKPVVPISSTTTTTTTRNNNNISPVPHFDQTFFNPEFRAKNKDFVSLGNANFLKMNNSDWTIVLNIRFIHFADDVRVVGSASASSAGSSLQIGVLKGGVLWVDTYIGGMTAGNLELNRWYEIAVCHSAFGEEMIYVDKVFRAKGDVPVFNSLDEVYVGRWMGYYFDFDLSRIRIYSKVLSSQEIQNIQNE